MFWLPFMFAASAVLSTASAIMGGMQAQAAGEAQANALEIDAERYEIKRDLSRTEASIQARRRWAEYTDAQATNVAAIAVSNLSLNSFNDLLAANKRKAAEDASLVEQSGRLQGAEFTAAAASTRVRAGAARAEGQMMMMLGMLQAGSSLLSSAFTYETSRTLTMPSLVE